MLSDGNLPPVAKVLYGLLDAISEDGEVEYQTALFAHWMGGCDTSLRLWMKMLENADVVKVFCKESGERYIKILSK